MPLDDLLEHLKKRSKRKLYSRVSDDHVLDPGYHAREIPPNGAYFEIRLAEMFLSYRSEYGREFIPFAVVASEFAYGGQRRSFPFFVGKELLSDVDSYVSGQNITYHNTRVVGPVPYAGDDVALFVGLYRAQVDDVARKLLGVLGKVLAVFDVTRLSSYIDVGAKLADGLYSLLNFKQLEYRTGDRDVFQDHGTSQRFREGYFVYVDCDDSPNRIDELWVQDGSLKTGVEPGSLKPFSDCDYCLVEIQSLETRNDYTSLVFHEKWKQARDRIRSGDEALAHSLFIECCQQIADSPDLTPTHAEALIQVYQANYEKDIEFYGKLRRQPQKTTPTVYRDATRGILDPQQRILDPQQRIMVTAQSAGAAGVEEKALQPLVELSENWKRIPHGEVSGQDVSDALLNEQLATVRSFAGKREPNPKALADALAIAAVTAG